MSTRARAHAGETPGQLSASTIARRVAAFDWDAVERDLDERGYARLPSLLESTECAGLVESFAEETLLRVAYTFEQNTEFHNRRPSYVKPLQVKSQV